VTDLQAAVEQRALGTPYVVETVDGGFDVRLDLVNQHWHTLFTTQGVLHTFVFHVRPDPERRTYSITDDEYAVTWTRLGTGAVEPVLAAAKSRQVGTVREFSSQKIWAWDDAGQYGKVVDYRFDSEEGRALVRAGAEAAGWKQTMGTAIRVGLTVGLLGLALALIVVLVLVVAR